MTTPHGVVLPLNADRDPIVAYLEASPDWWQATSSFPLPVLTYVHVPSDGRVHVKLPTAAGTRADDAELCAHAMPPLLMEPQQPTTTSRQALPAGQTYGPTSSSAAPC